MSVVQFDLAQWSVWPPARAAETETTPLPALDFLPAMQRRRLSGLARICFHVCWQVIPADQACGLVFCSRHGEAQRTVEMLQGINTSEPVSPTAFSHSVHNAIPALLSIARRDITEQVSIAQLGQDGLPAAFLEAAMMLNAGQVDQVVIICADEPLPKVYQPYASDFAAFSWATAFRLQRGTQWQLSLTHNAGTTNTLKSTEPHHPAPLQLAAALDNGQDNFTFNHDRQCWTWSRLHA